MSKVIPNQPNSAHLEAGRHNRGFPPNRHAPSRVEAGASGGNEVRDFPEIAVESLKASIPFDEEIRCLAVSRSALEEVLGWIERYVPRPVRFGESVVVDGGISILVLDGEERFDAVDLIRINGRPFTPEAPAVEPALPEELVDEAWNRLELLPGEVDSDWRAISREQLADAMLESALVTIRAMEIEDEPIVELTQAAADLDSVVIDCPHETTAINRTGDGLTDVETCLDCGKRLGMDAAPRSDELLLTADMEITAERGSFPRSHRGEGNNYVD